MESQTSSKKPLWAVLGLGILAVLAIGGVCSIGGCNSDSDPAADLPDEQREELEKTLPPDPGPEGDATLAGVDSNNNGVWDNVERKIVFTYPDSKRIQAALMQDARAFQEALFVGDDHQKAVGVAKKMDDAVDCIAYITDSVNNQEMFLEVGSQMEGWVVNTNERLEAYDAFNEALDPYTSTGRNTSEQKKGCNFDPDALPN